MFRFFKKKRHKTHDGQLALVLEAQDIDLFLDIGANVGQTGQKLRDSGYRKRIVSFEPIPDVHASLQIAARGDPEWLVADPVAFGAAAGRTILHVSEASDMSSALPATESLIKALPRTRSSRSIEAPVTTVAEILPLYARSENRIFLKIDTQGLDFDVLKGAEPVLERIAGVQVEMSLFPLYEGEPIYLDVVRYLHDRGYQPHLLTERYFSRHLNRQLQIDGVYFRS